MILKTCAKCGKLIPYGLARCSECESDRPQENKEKAKRQSKRYNSRRKGKADPKYKQFYNSKEWKMLSRTVLQESDYRCDDCKGIATDIHHEPPIQTDIGWTCRLDRDHVVALCVRCHNKRHERFKSKRDASERDAI